MSFYACVCKVQRGLLFEKVTDASLQHFLLLSREANSSIIFGALASLRASCYSRSVQI